jgi:uncharacterized protein
MPQRYKIAKSSLGLGLFASTEIAVSETIFYLTGRVMSFSEAVDSEQGEHSIQIGRNRYVSTHSSAKYPDSPARYLNHSCSPNAGFVDEIRLIALNPILPDEEIRFDYSTTMLERFWEMDCLCGAPNCRGRVRDFDLLPLPRQEFYVQQGIVPGFILDHLASEPWRERRVA